MSYDHRFISDVARTLEEYDLDKCYNVFMSKWYRDLHKYCVNVLTLWDERYKPLHPFENTTPGEVVSGWINQYRYDDLLQHDQLTKRLGVMADNREATVSPPFHPIF